MKIAHILLLLSFTITSCNSCKSVVPTLGYIPDTILAAGPWSLVSVTHSNSSLPRYVGTSADSVRFTWSTVNSNFVLDSMFYYIKGSINKYAVNKFSYGVSATNAPIDTVQISSNWTIGYNNYIVVQSYNNQILVFTINGSSNSDIETDSLRYK